MRRALRWVGRHWAAIAFVAGCAVMATGMALTIEASKANNRQDQSLEQIIARVEGDRIASDLAACESGNRLRRDIREAIAGLAERQYVIDYFAERFAPTNCAERINPGAPVP